MNPRSHKQGSAFIVYDADRLQHPGAELFDAEYWHRQGGLAGEAMGRGSALFLETPFGDAVLKHYLRGGLPGRFIHDRYLFTGWKRTRPLAEFHILAQLSEAGFPVPRPLAAIARRTGPVYTGSLLTARIADALPLADEVVGHEDEPDFWAAVGSCIRRFHDHGLVHADLNARNILVGRGNRIYLIDFDRARMAPGRPAEYARNLARLKRSFDKLWPQAVLDRLEPCWQSLLGAYDKGAEHIEPV
jgi:3-deoxy-D-manno-octulosonic acid kinase